MDHAHVNAMRALLVDSAAGRALEEQATEIERLKGLINTPQVGNFLEAVQLEAAHQTERWSVEHDEGKSPPEWLWLLGHLASKACLAAVRSDLEKALHHTISSAALCLNWHAHLSGVRSGMRPGISPPEAT